MKHNEQHIDDLFKEGLGDYTETPPPPAWDALEKRLAASPPRRFAIRKVWFFAAVALLFCIGGAVARKLVHDGRANANYMAAAQNSPTDGKTSSSTPAPAGNVDNPNTATAAGDNTPDENAGIMAGSTSNQVIHAKTGSAKKPTKVYKSTSSPTDDDDATTTQTSPTFTDNTKTIKTELVTEKAKETPAAKKDSAKAQDKKAVVKEDVKKPKIPFDRWEAGMKVGFERGFDNESAEKLVASPYVQFNISPKLAIMLQPSAKAAYLATRMVGAPRSYYKVNNDGVVQIDNSHPMFDPEFGGGSELYLTNVTYAQSHDSIVKSNHVGGSYTEYELPILAKYKLTKNCSVYGGVNMVYGHLTGITESTNTYQHLFITKDTSLVDVKTATTPALSSVIKYQGNAYVPNTPPQYAPAHGSTLRFGYMVGFTYEIQKRWLVDALVQQASVAPNTQGGINTNAPLSAPYFRFSLGYKIIK